MCCSIIQSWLKISNQNRMRKQNPKSGEERNRLRREVEEKSTSAPTTNDTVERTTWSKKKKKRSAIRWEKKKKNRSGGEGEGYDRAKKRSAVG